MLTVQTPYRDEDFAALTDRLYVCPQVPTKRRSLNVARSHDQVT